MGAAEITSLNSWICAFFIVSLGLVRRKEQFCREPVYSKWQIANNYSTCLPHLFCDSHPDKKPLFVGFDFLRDKFCIEMKLKGWQRTATGSEKFAAVKGSVKKFLAGSQKRACGCFMIIWLKCEKLLHWNLKMYP